MKRKELLIALGVVCLVIAGFGCYNFLRNNNVTSGEKIIKYEEDLLGISFSKYVEKATGEIHRTSGQEDYAKVIFAINSNKKDELERELKEKMNYDDRDLYKDYFDEDGSLINIYQSFLSGKIAKTREVICFLYEKNNRYYLKIVG